MTDNKQIASKMNNLKEHVLNFNTKCFGAETDPRHLGMFLLTQVIPKMEGNGDMAFAWMWAKSDVCLYNQQEYDAETTHYRVNHKMKKNDGETTWFYEFKKGNKKRKAIITTEIWFKKNGNHKTSPIALLLGQFFGAGLHIAKVKFEDVE